MYCLSVMIATYLISLPREPKDNATLAVVA